MNNKSEALDGSSSVMARRFLLIPVECSRLQTSIMACQKPLAQVASGKYVANRTWICVVSVS